MVLLKSFNFLKKRLGDFRNLGSLEGLRAKNFLRV